MAKVNTRLREAAMLKASSEITPPLAIPSKSEQMVSSTKATTVEVEKMVKASTTTRQTVAERTATAKENGTVIFAKAKARCTTVAKRKPMRASGTKT